MALYNLNINQQLKIGEKKYLSDGILLSQFAQVNLSSLMFA